MECTGVDQLPLCGDVALAVGELADAYAVGRSTWPTIPLSYESFRQHVVRHGYTRESGPEHPSDFYLSAACTSGRAAAYQALEAKFFSGLRQVVNRVIGEELVVDDVLQEVRTRLFVGQAPKISSYRGNGPLAGWLRSLAVNVAQDCRRSTVVQRGRLRKLALAQRDAPAEAHETTAEERLALRGEGADICIRAWREAISSLCCEERELLRQCFVYERSVDALGALYGVHRATIHRRLHRAIRRLRQHLREVLASHYRDLTDADRDAIAFSAGCQLNLTAVLGELDLGMPLAEATPPALQAISG